MNDGSTDLNAITQEIEINVNGPIRMVKQFLPHLKRQKSSAIINVSSGLAFVPFPISPIYSATKAALHSFTVALRVQMKQTTVKVIELAPPATETPLFSGDFDAVDLAGAKGMEVTKLVQIAIKGIEKGELEICPGLSVVLRLLSRIAPSFAVNMMAKANQKSLNRMLAQAAR